MKCKHCNFCRPGYNRGRCWYGGPFIFVNSTDISDEEIELYNRAQYTNDERQSEEATTGSDLPNQDA